MSKKHLVLAAIGGAFLHSGCLSGPVDPAGAIPSPLPNPMVPPPIVATTGWGTGLSLSAPVDAFFQVGAYTASWKFRGASGGARLDDGSGARAFAIDFSGLGGENIATEESRLDGRATFRETGDGALDADWTIMANSDAVLSEVMVEVRLPLGRVAGGFRVNRHAVPIPSAIPTSPHLFRGAASLLEALGADGNPWLEVEFPDTAQILIQDNRAWGNPIAAVRFFFALDGVEAGRAYPLRARFRIPGRSISFKDSAATVIQAGPDWIPVPTPQPGEDWIEPGSALDLSATMPRHEPAGAFGRVVAVGDHFELEGRPGEEIRFCGVNVVHGANTPSTPEDAERFAANLARMGFNSVRIHHHERPLLASGDGAALTLDPGALDRFDALCAACVRHGLYITTDLYVSREPIAWRALGIDSDGTMKKDVFKRLVVFHEGAFSNLVAWTRLFLGHVNPYTGRSLAEEPGLATLAIVNEGNLGNWGRDALISTPGVKEAWEKWCAERGIEAADLSALPADLYEAKGANRQLSNAFALFLADSETRFHKRMAAIVRDELGCRAPLAGLSSWYNPASYSLARQAFDYDDDHTYVDHPFFLGKSWRLPSSHSGANPMLGGDAVPGLAWRRLFGKPFCVTEWNWAAPGQFRAASGLVMGAFAARQGWSGLWRFAWSHDRQGVDAPGSVRMRYFDLHADPALCASERATICLFGRGDLSPLPPNSASPIEADAAAIRRGEHAARRLTAPAGAPSGWESRIGVRLGDREAPTPPDPTSAPLQIANLAAPLPERGAFVVDTPRTAGGFAPDGTLEAGPLRFTVKDAPAAIWASSVDGKPIADSSRILLSHVTDAKNTEARFDDDTCRVWRDYGRLPALMRRGAADISLALDGGAGTQPPFFAVYRLSATGKRLGAVPASWDNATGRLSFSARTDYDSNAATCLYEIVRLDSPEAGD